MRCLLGLIAPTSGSVQLEGRPWDPRSAAARQRRRTRYQFVPQDASAALDPQQTALEAISETLRVLGGRYPEVARHQGRALLERLGLGHRLHALPRELSAGEQRRVTLARVLALSPRLIVADEPTSGLDADRREDVLRILFGNLPPSAACLWVTHEATLARAWCTRALFLMEGRIVDDLNWPDDEPTVPWARRQLDSWGTE